MNTLANNPNQWPPYETYKDCSQGICSIYCPQWCYIIFPPPPPFNLGDNSDSSADFSPLIIAVIGILASALVLVSYYTIISKYCKRRNNNNNNNTTGDIGGGEFEDNFSEGNLQTHPNGLDESLIKSITVCKYKKSEGLIEGTDCSVCLSEFEENESLRLLPKCNHAFHLPCIDTWLKSQSSCPLCRSNIAVLSFTGPPHQLRDDDQNDGSINDPNNSMVEYNQHRREESVVVVEELENVHAVESVCENGSKNQSSEQRGGGGGGEWRVEIGEVGGSGGFDGSPLRRSFSTNACVQCEGNVVSVADILKCGFEEGEEEEEEEGMQRGNEKIKRKKRNGKVLDLGMKRSFSSGRFVVTRYASKGNTSDHVVFPI